MQCPACHYDASATDVFCPNCRAQLPPDPLVGRVIGSKYRVVRALGQGGMGTVYQGEQQLGTSTRRVAIKTLHKQLSEDGRIKARFERECGTIAALEHPNTIQVFDFGATDDGQLYIVMEFVQGGNLADAIAREGTMDPLRVERIVEQICGSLEEAHAQGIVHRDLKPDNIILTERAGKKDFVKVLDFGIAKRQEEDKNEAKLTQAGMVLGTPPYMSPEQFTGKTIDPRSDQYSLGVMAYEMLTGKLPFHAETAWEWATQHMTANPIPMEVASSGLRAPQGMRETVKRALAKMPEQRFANVREFSAAFSSGGPVVQSVPPHAMPMHSPSHLPSSAPNTHPSPGGYGPPMSAPLPVDYAPAPMAPPGMPYGMPPHPMTPAYGMRGQTQIGDVQVAGMAMGAPPMMPPYGVAAPATPVYGMPQQVPYMAPPHPYGHPNVVAGGGGTNTARKVLLVVAIVVGLATIGVVVAFAMMSKSPGPTAKGPDLGSTATSPATTSMPANTGTVASINDPPTATTTESIAPQSTTTHTATTSATATHSTAPTPTPSLTLSTPIPVLTHSLPIPIPTLTQTTPTATATEKTPPTPTQTTPQNREPPQCGQARAARDSGRMREFHSLAAQCRAFGGHL